MASLVVAGACLALAGPLACAAEGGKEGGAANLPDRGIAGWERVGTTDAPFVLTADGAQLLAPSVVRVERDVASGTVVIYAHRLDVASGVASLVRVERRAGVFGAPEPLGLDGTEPSVVVADGMSWLAYVDAAGAIAIATASDGRTFSLRPASGIAAARTAPSLVVADGRVHLYMSTGTHLVHADADATTLAFGAETEVLAPGVGCVANDGEPEACWDEDAIVDAEVRLATSPTGQRVFRMFYAGHAGGDSDIGFAASYDGVTFVRYAFNPVLTGTFDERSPSVVIAGGSYELFWSEVRSTTKAGIAEAIHAPSALAERW